MSSLQRSISSEYIPNQPVGLQFFPPEIPAGGLHDYNMYLAATSSAHNLSRYDLSGWNRLPPDTEEMHGSSHYIHPAHLRGPYEITHDNQVLLKKNQ